MEIKNNAHFFYVVYCKDHTLYAGYTNDLVSRIATHNQGKGAKYTKLSKRRPVKLIYAEQWISKSLAMSAEARFKRLKRYEKEQYLKEHGLRDLQQKEIVIYDYTDRVERLEQMLTTKNIREEN